MDGDDDGLVRHAREQLFVQPVRVEGDTCGRLCHLRTISRRQSLSKLLQGSVGQADAVLVQPGRDHGLIARRAKRDLSLGAHGLGTLPAGDKLRSRLVNRGQVGPVTVAERVGAAADRARFPRHRALVARGLGRALVGGDAGQLSLEWGQLLAVHAQALIAVDRLLRAPERGLGALPGLLVRQSIQDWGARPHHDQHDQDGRQRQREWVNELRQRRNWNLPPPRHFHIHKMIAALSA